MAKFLCDKRVKWRSTSSSPNSGKLAMSFLSSATGICSSSLPASVGHEKPLLPGEPVSKISFGARVRERWLLAGGSDKPLDLLSLVELGNTHQETIGQFRIVILQWNAGDDLAVRASHE